tara:strand:+ start:136 stop:363 length:228 start_codon:yes stop_codon:yes gene_type:complete
MGIYDGCIHELIDKRKRLRIVLFFVYRKIDEMQSIPNVLGWNSGFINVWPATPSYNIFGMFELNNFVDMYPEEAE